MKATRRERIVELDGMRGLAALVIVTFHLAPSLITHGWPAVDCLFVLSGYLITSILLRSCHEPHYFRTFHLRRMLRIWPIYYLTLIPVVLGYFVLPTKYPIDLSMIMQYLTFTQETHLIWDPTLDREIRAFSHTWTLAIEQQFYLVWPFVIWVSPRRLLVPICMMITCGSFGLRASGMSRALLPSHCYGLGLGALLAAMLSDPGESIAGRYRVARLLGVVSAVATILLLPHLLGYPTFLGFRGKLWKDENGLWLTVLVNLLWYGLIGTTVVRSGHPWLAFLRVRWLVFIGTISYGLYLYHILVMFVFEWLFRTLGIHHRFDGSRPLYRSFLEIGASFLVAILSWHLIEQPIFRLKNRFCPRVVDGTDGTADHRPWQGSGEAAWTTLPAETRQLPGSPGYDLARSNGALGRSQA